MDRLYKLASIRREPLITICWIIAIAAVVGGTWILSPIFDISDIPSGSSALSQTILENIATYVISLPVIGSGLIMIYGIVRKKDNILAWGLFINLIIRIFAFLVACLVYGLPPTWISAVTMICIVLVLYLVTKRHT